MKRFHEEWAIVATVDPIDANNADLSSDVVDMSKYSEIAVIVMAGVIAACATDAIAVKAATDSAGTGSATTITSKTIAMVATDDGFQWIITILPEEIQSQLGSTFRYLVVTQNNSAHSQLMAILVLGRVKYGLATEQDLSSVQTIVD